MKSTTLISSMKVSLVSLFVISSVLLTSNSAFAVGAVPVITRTGSATVNIEYGDTYTDAGATASDVEDGNLTGSIITTGTVNNMVLGTYTIQYNVTDSDTNAAVTVTRTVNVVQKVLTVTGITASNKDYDGTTSATLNTGGAALVGVVGAEDVTLNLGGATGTFANKNVGNGKTVTVAGLTLGGTATLTNYSLTQPTTTANITTRAITVTAAANDRPYTGLTTATGTPTLTAGTLGTGDTATYTQSYDTATVGTGKTLTPVAAIKDAGLVDVTANYAITYVNDTNGVITQAPLTITADAKTRVYGDANPALTVSYSGFVNSETSAVLSTPVTVTTAASSTSNVGTVSIVPSAAVATNYAISFVNGNLTITARPLTVTADAQTKVYGNADPAFTYVSSGLVNGDTLSGTLSRVAGTNVGTYGITQGSLTAGGNYTISYVGANLTVTTRAITVTAAANDRPYTGLTTATGTPTVTSGTLASGDTANFSQVYDTATVGTGKTLTPSGTVTDGNSGNNYTYTFVPVSTGVITQAPLTITADAKTKVYGTANPTFTVSYTGLVNSEVGTVVAPGLTVSSAATSTTFVGTASIVPSGATSTNYAITFVNGTLTITQAPITITADAKTKVYGDVDPSLSYGITSGSLVAGGALTGSLSRAAGTNVGTYAITSTLANSNYAITYVGANLSITAKPLTVTAVANDRVYNGLTTATGTPIVTGGLVGGDTANFIQTYDTATVGTGKTLTPSGTVTDGNSGNNYTYTFVPVTTGVITQAPLTITADAKTRVYGDANPALTVSYSGFVNSETSAVLSTPVTVTTAASSTSNVGTVSIVPSAAVATNYAISFVNGNLTITARPLTVTADAQTKVYGAVDPTFTQSITLGNLVNGDTLSGSLTRATGTSIGTYAINQGTLTAGTNYTITYVPANLTITAKPITVTANPITKERLAVDPTLTYTGTSSLEVGDSFTGALTRAAGETTGVYAITQGTLTAGTNYTITFTGANFTIVDTTAPTLTSVSIASNNASTTLAKVGDTVTLTFSASEAINAPTVTIAGQAAVTTGTTTGPYTATYVLQSTDTTGTVPFTINFSDIASNAGTQVSSTTNASSVRFDKTPPTATIVMGSSLLTFNQTTSVTITFSEKVMGFDATDVSTPSGTLSALTTNDGGITFTGTYTPGGSVLALSNVMVVSTGYTDLAGNAPVATASTANYVVNTLVTSAGGGFGGNANNNAQANAPTTPATNANGQVLGAAATNIVSDLRPGRRGEEVSNLQKMLINQGFMNGTPTGFFGVATRAAVAKWQAKNGLPATGFFGPLSRAFLNRTNQ